MMRLAIAFVIAAAANAQLGDETSLIQLQQALKKAPVQRVTPEGILAEPVDLVSEDYEFSAQESAGMAEMEKFELEETSITTPAGCVDMGCFGKGPACGGNDFDCTRMGWQTTGYYKSCSTKDTCKSGYKVRCAKCSAALSPAITMAPPVSPAPQWVTPPPPAPTPAPFTMAPPVAPVLPKIGFRPYDKHGVDPAQDKWMIDTSKSGSWGGYCLCPDGIEYGVGDKPGSACSNMVQNCIGGAVVTTKKAPNGCHKYGKLLSANYLTGWSHGVITCANPDVETPLNLLIQALKNATTHLKGLKANATHAKKMEKRAGKGARSARKSAVIFAKKVSLSNISIYQATSAMSGAYFSQKAASEEAQTALQKMKNAYAHMRYYQKVYIDKEQVIKDAHAALKVGKDAYKKAKSDLKIAKKAHKEWAKFEKQKMSRLAKGAKRRLKSAEKAAVKWGMEKAYLESSEGDRNMSNVPPYGRGGKKWHVGFGRMGKR